MIDHLSTYATDYERTRRFYEAALAALGYQKNMEMVTAWDAAWPTRRCCAFGPGERPMFWVIEVTEPASPRHVAFSARNRGAVDLFYKAALASGGKDNGPPGERAQYHPGYYGAFALDPDGNNVEAVNHGFEDRDDE